MSETKLVRLVLQYLHMHQIFAWRNNTGALPVGKRFIRFGYPGSSDVLGVLPADGRLLAIECKVGRGRLTSEQNEFIDRVNRNGGLAFVVRSLDDLIRALTMEGVVK